jgi:hypothetical protein
MPSVEPYQRLIIDFEVYLNHEITEWSGMAEATRDRTDKATFDALLDLKDELDRLKRQYFPTQGSDL